MPIFTCITENRDNIHLKQMEAKDGETALQEAISSLPYDDSVGPFDEELEWLQKVAGGEVTVTLHPVVSCKNTWLWLEGSGYDPKYITYIIKTDVTNE